MRNLLLFLTLFAVGSGTAAVPLLTDAPLLAILNKPLYADATWSIRVLDTDTGEVLYDLNPDQMLLIASMRKLFSVGVTLDELGGGHRFVTRVHRVGDDLILVAAGDVTMGMRRQPDGTMAISRVDHNEALAVGNAVLTDTDALAAYRELAQGVAAGGITDIPGEVIIDDRLFVPFVFRDQYVVRPIFVNENFLDFSLQPTAPGQPATLTVRPPSAAFTVNSTVTTVTGEGVTDIDFDPFLPDCIGTPGCSGMVTGELPIDGAPPFGEYPLVQNFRITEPSNFARTVFIEELEAAGVAVTAPTVAPNPDGMLPPPENLTPQNQVAEYTSLPYSEYARLILKVSFNLGADTSLMLFGLSQGVDTLAEALTAERQRLTRQFGIDGQDFAFLDGSGGAETAATSRAITQMLQEMASRPTSAAFRAGLPLLGVDGTLGIIEEFKKDPTLAGAEGQVVAKTGTYVDEGPNGLPRLRARGIAGYINARSGRRLTFVIVVNDVGEFEDFLETVEVNEDVATISALLWRDN